MGQRGRRRDPTGQRRERPAGEARQEVCSSRTPGPAGPSPRRGPCSAPICRRTASRWGRHRASRLDTTRLLFKFSSKTSITLSERRDCVHEDPGAGHLSTRPGCLLLAVCPAVWSPPPSPALVRTGELNQAGLPAGCGPFPLAAHSAAESQEAQLLSGSWRRESECRARTVTHLTLQRHVVDLGVQQHGAGAERHRLVRDGSRCPAVNPQDLLLAGDYELFLGESSQMSRTHPDGRLAPPPPRARWPLLPARCCAAAAASPSRPPAA